MRRFLLTLSLALAATAAHAGNVACTTARVNDGLCTATSHRLLFYSIPNTDPDGAGPKVGMASELADAICAPGIGNYQATLADGEANPETCAQFADRWIKENFRDLLRRYREAQAEAAKQATLAADPVPALP